MEGGEPSVNDISVLDYLEQAQRAVSIELQMEPDYLFSKVNTGIPKRDLKVLEQPRGLIPEIWQAVKSLWR